MKNMTSFVNSIVVFMLLAFHTGFAFGQRAQTRDSKIYDDHQHDKLFGQVLSILPEHRVPAGLSSLQTSTQGRCGSMILAEARLCYDHFTAEQKSLLQAAFARPDSSDLPFKYLSPSGEFKFHYTLSGRDAVSAVDVEGESGVPDYVEAVAAAFDSSFNLEVNLLGYLKPPVDGTDGPEYDVYIERLSSGFYGLTTTDGGVVTTAREDQKSFIRVDNDFLDLPTEGLDGARVTAAHEYFHAIHFGYRTTLTSNDAWYYELCSTWMEDVAYDEINDYYFLVPQFYSRAGEPFNLFDRLSLYNYGAAVWYHFLMKKYADPSIVRRTWEIIGDQLTASQSSMIGAIELVLFQHSQAMEFEDEFAEFAIWNYFTDSRADPINYYEEGEAYPFIRMQQSMDIADTTSFPISVVDSSFSASHRYYQFTVLTEGENLSLATSVADPDDWQFGAIVTTPQGNSTAQLFLPGENRSLGVVAQFSEIVIIPIHTQTIPGSESLRLRSERSTFQFSLFRGAVGESERAITSIYPNPFVVGNPDPINLEFKSATLIDVEVRILSSSGVLLKTVKANETPAAFAQGEAEDLWVCTWDGTDRASKEVSSGIYIFHLRQDDFTAMEKFAIIRE
ncbi:hypothetical protein MJD09_07870 [bacterium]|nr:hypothetical protein [bacterium]